MKTMLIICLILILTCVHFKNSSKVHKNIWPVRSFNKKSSVIGKFYIYPKDYHLKKIGYYE